MTSEERFRLKAGMTSAEEAGMTAFRRDVWGANHSNHHTGKSGVNLWQKQRVYKEILSFNFVDYWPPNQYIYLLKRSLL